MGRMANGSQAAKTRYEAAAANSKAYVDAITRSTARKKIVVAGPGTGKTYLFKKILEGKTNCLTLTFVNSLVEDLSLDLCGLSEVRTLHSFARSELARILKASGGVKVFPKLSRVIGADAKVLLDRSVDFDALFHKRDDGNPDIQFYSQRRRYYDKHFGYSDIIFALALAFEQKDSRIPSFTQVLVDEFQDFNPLEVSLIELLGRKSPVLIAGDDDQALYDFKNASAAHIRDRHAGSNTDYESFSLPYCYRCTRVIVDAINDVIAQAHAHGFLKGRIVKDYVYFESLKKDVDSDGNPAVVKAHVFAAQLPGFIGTELGRIAQQVRGPFSVLIISATRVHSNAVKDGLEAKGFQNVTGLGHRDEAEPTPMDALNLLLEDDAGNLGWRVVADHVIHPDQVAALIKASAAATPRMIDLIGANERRRVKRLLTTLRAVRDRRNPDREKLAELQDFAQVSSAELVMEELKAGITSEARFVPNPGLRKLRIKATTVQSSKGLAADYVFITHCDDKFFIKDPDKTKITDQDICNFVVAVTRAKKRVYIVSVQQPQGSTFTRWIKPERIETRVFGTKRSK
jgi:hypothetical protein